MKENKARKGKTRLKIKAVKQSKTRQRKKQKQQKQMKQMQDKTKQNVSGYSRNPCSLNRERYAA